MTSLISVIVVAYNAEMTLPRCLTSIIGQSLKELEIIVVDDGSTDDTAAVLDSFANKDPRVKVIHQKNAGVGKARQVGIDAASGQYSVYVDADDWIEPDMLETMYGKAFEDHADMVFCDYVEDNGLGTFYRKQMPRSYDSKQVMQQLFTELHGSLCNKLIRRELYSGLCFLEGLNYCEDEYIVIRMLSKGCKVSYVNKGFYHYDKTANNNSISNLWSSRPVGEYRLYIDGIKEFFNTPELKKFLDDKIAGIIKKLTYAPKEYYQECRDFYRQYRTCLWRSRLPFPKKLFCALYFNGFSALGIIRSQV